MAARLDGGRRSDAKQDPVKMCPACGIAFARKRFKSALEDYGGFAKRITCSIKCAAMLRDKKQSLEVQLWQHVTKGDPLECWPWLASTDRKGYGRINDRGRFRGAHRTAWEVTNGEIPDGLFVCHHCDNTVCCNPSHLFLGTAKDNTQDMMRKGRYRGGPNQPNS